MKRPKAAEAGNLGMNNITVDQREKARGRQQRWRAAHPKEYVALHREASRKWKKANPEKHREWCRLHPDKHRTSVRKWMEKNTEKAAAHTILNDAVKAGRITRPDTCPCGNQNPEAHHSDYSKPLMVYWLCSECHKKLHRKDG
jgi:hypothetical protein